MAAVKVRAIKQGFYKLFREEGVEFEITEEKHFSKNWMERLDGQKSKDSDKSEKPKSEASRKSSDVI